MEESISFKIVKSVLSDILHEFITPKEKTQSHPIADKITNKYPYEVIIMKTINQHSGNLCGFYSLFYVRMYLKYLRSNYDDYYLTSLCSYKKFYKYYSKTIAMLSKNFPKDKNELYNEGSLERYHMDYILNTNYIKKDIDIKDIELNIIRIYFVGGTFANDKSQLKEIESFFMSMKENSKDKVFILFLGLSAHWIVLINDNNNKFISKEHFLLFDSYDRSAEIFYIEDNDTARYKYIDTIDLTDQTQFKKKKMTDYDKKSFNFFIKDYQSLFSSLSTVLSKITTEHNIISTIVLEHYIRDILASYEEMLGVPFEYLSSFEDKFLLLMMIYNWLISQYHPKILKENIMDNIVGNNNSDMIKRYCEFCIMNNEVIQSNINCVFEGDIVDILNEFVTLNKNILHAFNVI